MCGTDIICEKPLVLHAADLYDLQELETLTGKKINTILQLRLHAMLKNLRQDIASAENGKRYTVSVEYFTPRGKWYHASWKGDANRSGGIATNIGIHLFDLVIWLFGAVQEVAVQLNSSTESRGTVKLEKADVEWRLNIQQDLDARRRLIIDGKAYEFTEGFADLHTASYEAILKNEGFTTDDVRPSIELAERIRQA
jgi:UDP-N-acetyl-2-amino-2-deoxyglucuronate dehydrogenase